MADTTNAYDVAEEGFDGALSGLHGILRQIKEGQEYEARQHPFYTKVRAYMDDHPFPPDPLYYSTYCVGLFGEYLTFAVKAYTDKCNGQFQTELEANNIPQIREALLSSGSGITADDLKCLHNLISRVLLWIAPSSVFMQGMADQLILSLISRDEASGRYVFQRLIDGEI